MVRFRQWLFEEKRPQAGGVSRPCLFLILKTQRTETSAPGEGEKGKKRSVSSLWNVFQISSLVSLGNTTVSVPFGESQCPLHIKCSLSPAKSNLFNIYNPAWTGIVFVCPCKFYMLKSYAQCDGIMRWRSWEAMRVMCPHEWDIVPL